MRVIGLTGGIASGKTTVSNHLATLGAAIVDTDELAREVVLPGEPALAEIVAAFGSEVLRPDGTLDRAKLGQIVFRDDAKRARLNAMTHPRIRERMLARVGELRGAVAPPPAVVLVVPLLFENGLEALVEESWLVAVPEDVQRARLMGRDGFDAAEADRRIAAQMPLAEKRKRATRTLENAGDVGALKGAVEAAWVEAVQQL